MHVYCNYYKKNYSSNIKIFFCSVSIRKINLSFDELRLIAQVRNISGYESKSKEDLIKALSETKLETPKPDTKIRNTKTKNTKTNIIKTKNIKIKNTKTKTKTRNKSS